MTKENCADLHPQPRTENIHLLHRYEKLVQLSSDIASTLDPDLLLNRIVEAAKDADPVSFREFEGKEHGTNLLSAHPGLDMTIITGWLLNHLPPDR